MVYVVSMSKSYLLVVLYAEPRTKRLYPVYFITPDMSPPPASGLVVDARPICLFYESQKLSCVLCDRRYYE